jgi:hypothetical protein
MKSPLRCAGDGSVPGGTQDAGSVMSARKHVHGAAPPVAAAQSTASTPDTADAPSGGGPATASAAPRANAPSGGSGPDTASAAPKARAPSDSSAPDTASAPSGGSGPDTAGAPPGASTPPRPRAPSGAGAPSGASEQAGTTAPATAAPYPRIDPTGLTARQRKGQACVSCHKKWPRPSVLVGYLPTGQPLYVCDDCVAVIEPVTDADTS